VAEVVQAARGIESATLVQVDPAEGARGPLAPIWGENSYLAERIVDVAFDDVARVVKERDNIVVGVLHHPQPFVQRAVAVGVPMPLLVTWVIIRGDQTSGGGHHWFVSADKVTWC
jgi:hypothetical protein